MLILGLETSCDETSLALVEYKAGRFFVRKNLVASQIPIHQKYGGVVPEVAARNHVVNIVPLLREVLPFKKKINTIAVTSGPGLVTSLLVGVETARTLAWQWHKPLIAINHLEGHIYANWLDKDTLPTFPAVALIISGGHTELLLIKNHLQYRLIGQTRDDAAGECFDKAGKIMGMPYPGGPALAKLAQSGNPKAVAFPRPMLDKSNFPARGGQASGLDFSFSGLKTSILYHCQKNPPVNEQAKKDICASFQQAIIDVVVAKTVAAVKKYKVKTLLLGGGVAANQELQKQLADKMTKEVPQTMFAPLNPTYCGDNAAMIAVAGYFHASKKDFTPWQKIDVNPNWEL